MNLRPTRTFVFFLCFSYTLFLIILSCSKDRDILLDAVLDKEEILGIEEDTALIPEDEESEHQNSTETSEGSVPGNTTSQDLESRTTVFPSSNDAYVQNGKGYNQDIIRLQEDIRRSFLMFDLSPIAAIGGVITSAHLEFIINTDDGSGTIKVYKATSNDWTEDNLSAISAPETLSALGEVEGQYKIGENVQVDLDITLLTLEVTTLILEHKDGDDLAFASKENSDKIGPQLVVTYEVATTAEAIIIVNEQVIEATDNTSEEETTQENTEEENTPEEENASEEENPTEEDTPEEEVVENMSPNAIAEASIISGEVPLQVSFNSNKSSDDKAIVSYNWNFNDGNTSTTNNPIHTFIQAGVYEVSLTVTDAEGLSATDQITITVNEKQNEAPIARAIASVQSGTAPLVVNFNGSNSSDDTGIVSYFWDFSGGSSSVSNPNYTFENPGNYTITLTVTDAQGLTHTTSLAINVTEAISNDNQCVTNGGPAGAEGLKQWCWSDLAQEINNAGAQSGFSNNQLAKSVHYNANGVYVQNGRLHFKLNPTVSSSNGLNYRQEIRDNPASVRHALGTEQWWGFDYKFGDDYIADDLPWIMWQTHGYFSAPADPLTALELAPSNYLGNSNPKGELFISNAAFSSANPKKIPTGIVPRAGQTLKVVIQIVWGDNNTGLFKVWIDDVLVYNQQERTVYSERPEGGYWKIGIYKWRWRQQSNVNASANLGINELNASIGPLKVIKKSPSNATYLSNEYNTVRPR